MFRSLFANMPEVVKNLLIINVLMYLATMVWQDFMVGEMSLYYFDSRRFRFDGLEHWFNPYQLITYMFMHGGMLHIFFNMYILVMFGASLERTWGPKRFLVYYLICGLGAALIHTGVQAAEVYSVAGTLNVTPEMIVSSIKLRTIYSVPTLGASGAVFGILLAFGMFFPNMQLMLIIPPMPIKAKYLVIVMILIELYLGMRNAPGDNIAHFAHLGGAVFGFLVIKFWQYDRRRFY